MKIKCFGTGSKGNGYLIDFGKDAILLEAGVNYWQHSLDIPWSKIRAVFITHNHADHISELKQLMKKIPQASIIMSKGTYDSFIKDCKSIDAMILRRNYNKAVNVEGFTWVSFGTYHDAPDPVGYHFIYNDQNIFFVTDTGKIPSYFKRGVFYENSIFLIEGNYDKKVITYDLEHNIRTMSSSGHLSIQDLHKFIRIQDKNNEFYIIHGSGTNLNEKSDLIFEDLKEYGYVIERVFNGWEYIC